MPIYVYICIWSKHYILYFCGTMIIFQFSLYSGSILMLYYEMCTIVLLSPAISTGLKNRTYLMVHSSEAKCVIKQDGKQIICELNESHKDREPLTICAIFL